MKYTSLDHLSTERRREVDAASNLLGDGLRDLLAGLYSDKAHFIYELLQNAEDAHASSVSFHVEEDRLVFSHDGTEDFSLADIVAITRIGSNKRDDDTKIGQFGVGFKAVFSYTARPVIQSGDYAFAIEEMFIPRPVDREPMPGFTEFTFPFDRGDKPADVARVEIEEGLRGLEDTTLLFLTSIRQIRFTLSGGDTGSLERIEETYPLVSITHRVGDESLQSKWLRLVGDRSLSPIIPEGRTVAAAFHLEEDTERKPGKGKRRALAVGALKRGETCVFFPAPKEQSDLKFHIHAPFAPTPSRESIKEIPENAELVSAIGKLIVGSLPMLRDEGWLADGLLAALPNPEDELVAPYDGILDALYDAFRTNAFTPTIGGGYAPAAEIVASPGIFRTALSASDLSFLTALIGDYPASPRWLPERTGRANQFLLGLDVREFGWSELDDVFAAVGVDYDEGDTDSTGHQWRSWLEGKDDAQLGAVYELLGAGFEAGEFRSGWYLTGFDGPLIRVWAEGSPTLVPKGEAHLPATPDDTTDGRVVRDVAYFEDDAHSRSKTRRMAFFSGIEVRRWDERALVKARVKDYEDQRWPEDQQHFNDLRLFIAYLKGSPRDSSLFRDVQIVKVDGEHGELWAKTNQVYLDSPFKETGLSALYGHGTTWYPLSSSYRGRVAGVDDFVLALGGKDSLSIRGASASKNPEYEPRWYTVGTRWTDQGTKRDWDLPEVPAILESGNRPLLSRLWDLAVSSPEHYARAVFQLNGSATSHPMRSQLAQRLEGEWILDRAGELRTPRSMTVEELPPGWAEPPARSLVMALGFGADARERDTAAQVRAERAREIGIPIAFLDVLDELAENEREAAFAEFIDRARAHRHFPVSTSVNPTRRAAVVGAEATDAPDFATERRLRSVVIGRGENAQRTRQYLREQYTDDAGIMYCQLCHNALPFKVSDEWYFEAVQFVKARAKTHHQNALATCAACSALYSLTRSTADDALIESLENEVIDSEVDRVTLRVILYGRRHEVWFTGRHALDLRTVLQTQGGARRG